MSKPCPQPLPGIRQAKSRHFEPVSVETLPDTLADAVTLMSISDVAFVAVPSCLSTRQRSLWSPAGVVGGIGTSTDFSDVVRIEVLVVLSMKNSR